LHIVFFILNPFDYDSRAQLICHDILSSGWRLDIIATIGGKIPSFGNADIHRLPQPVWPTRKRRFIEYNIRATSLAKRLRADIYHAVDLDTLWAAVNAARTVGGKVVYESRELYTELMSLSGRPIVRAFWSILEKKLIRKVDVVVTVNQAIAEEMTKRYRINPPEIVMNVARSGESIEPIDLRKEFNLQSKFVLIFQGILRPGQGILRAIELIVYLPEVSLVFIGDGPLRDTIEKRANDLGISNRVRIAGKIEPGRLAHYTSGADAGLILIEPVALNNRLALPQKLFQYISAETPPIVSDLPMLRQIVQEDKLGLVLKDGLPKESAEAVRDFLNNGLEMAIGQCRIAKRKYCWEIEGKKFINLYRNLV